MVRKAFTMIELKYVLIRVAILVAVAVPKIDKQHTPIKTQGTRF